MDITAARSFSKCSLKRRGLHIALLHTQARSIRPLPPCPTRCQRRFSARRHTDHHQRPPPRPAGCPSPLAHRCGRTPRRHPASPQPLSPHPPRSRAQAWPAQPVGGTHVCGDEAPQAPRSRCLSSRPGTRSRGSPAARPTRPGAPRRPPARPGPTHRGRPAPSPAAAAASTTSSSRGPGAVSGPRRLPRPPARGRPCRGCGGPAGRAAAAAPPRAAGRRAAPRTPAPPTAAAPGGVAPPRSSPPFSAGPGWACAAAPGEAAAGGAS